ncbi:MAG: tetratricopeptide repeat protein, partial [Gemmatimonadales bacterium]
TEADINLLGYQLLGQGKTDEAIALFRQNTRDYPRSWNTYDSLGEALAKKGDVKGARASYEKALSMAPDDQQRARIRAVLDGLK